MVVVSRVSLDPGFQQSVRARNEAMQRIGDWCGKTVKVVIMAPEGKSTFEGTLLEVDPYVHIVLGRSGRGSKYLGFVSTKSAINCSLSQDGKTIYHNPLIKLSTFPQNMDLRSNKMWLMRELSFGPDVVSALRQRASDMQRAPDKFTRPAQQINAVPLRIVERAIASAERGELTRAYGTLQNLNNEYGVSSPFQAEIHETTLLVGLAGLRTASEEQRLVALARMQELQTMLEVGLRE